METSVTQSDRVATVQISGSVDGLTAEELQRVLSSELDAGRRELVADLGAVEYTSSAGLRVLLGTVKRARSLGGDLRLAGARPDVLQVLTLSGFTNILKVFDAVDDAVASFG